ncbi:hypothetical protein HPB48_016756 [Haemaphysalis longicornis]|uniref:Uncharacterized protein n=1 Tax=Haemaphysalis longicornis TaxID=44386 RepID=A0A9J6G9V7_HAELO|nr:hypothetical protein HPB48_016756 [Haemaphysalis longicornis]
MNAAGLNSAERRDTYFKPRPRQNLTVISPYRMSAKDKILVNKQVTLEDRTHTFSAYTASYRTLARMLYVESPLKQPNNKSIGNT